MPLKNDDNQGLKQKDLVFILAIAGRIDAQTRLLAEELNESRHVYYVYSVLDSLSSSYSMFKYFFDVCLGGSADEMHELMLSPAGIVGITLESVFLFSFSFLACLLDKEKEANYKKRIADAWPYFRDVMKGLKNAYKGWRSAVVALGLLGVTDVNYLIAPVGIILGLLAAANRYLMRYITEARKEMMDHNAKLLASLKKLPSLTAEEARIQLSETPIKSQTDRDRYLGFLGSAVGGAVDGLYLYVGVLTLCVLSPHLLIAMAAICAFYTLACIISRVYEEYEFQLKLQVSQTKCRLVIYTKQIQTIYAELLLLEEKQDKTPEDVIQIQIIKKELAELIEQFETQRRLLQHQSNRSYFGAALGGMKSGLQAYGVLSSVLFLISSFLVMGSVSFPPIFIAVVVCLGLLFIAGFVIDALVKNYQHNKGKTNPDNEYHYQQLLAMKEHIEEPEIALLKADQLDSSLKAGLDVKAAPVSFFQEWFEVFRSLFSGLGKGQKFVDFAGNPLQETGADGHYHDTPVMYVLGTLSALLFGFILALRALARGFGRPALGADSDLTTAVIPPPINKNIPPKEPVIQELVRTEPVKTKDPGESIQSKKRNDSPKNSDSLLSIFGIFKEKSSATLSRARSENDLTNLVGSDTVVGLG